MVVAEDLSSHVCVYVIVYIHTHMYIHTHTCLCMSYKFFLCILSIMSSLLLICDYSSKILYHIQALAPGNSIQHIFEGFI